ncbi:hypothetical protein BV25DRAFT_1921315 [Artomyces pyxidatus]|uniref:Uncharacterized protein n=1 Tax=Artomyces pyxidatus TaxID=48021 RepID=A0ACB8SJM4_9AGAM|nr:hypothetical protein BV25DRAFT_1921315 [Artomyces pyxidatus]
MSSLGVHLFAKKNEDQLTGNTSHERAGPSSFLRGEGPGPQRSIMATARGQRSIASARPDGFLNRSGLQLRGRLAVDAASASGSVNSDHKDPLKAAQAHARYWRHRYAASKSHALAMQEDIESLLFDNIQAEKRAEYMQERWRAAVRYNASVAKALRAKGLKARKNQRKDKATKEAPPDTRKAESAAMPTELSIDVISDDWSDEEAGMSRSDDDNSDKEGVGLAGLLDEEVGMSPGDSGSPSAGPNWEGFDSPL